MKKGQNMKKYLNLEYLNTFLVAAETKKLNQTAERIYRSHSAVSIQIKKLEEHVGTPLFIRNKNSLTLTQAGEILLDYARELLNLNHATLQSLAGKPWHRRIALGVPTDYAKHFMEHLYLKIQEKLPGYHITVDFSQSRKIRNGIREHKIDLGIVAMEPQYTDDIQLWEEGLHWVYADNTQDPTEPFPIALFSDDCVINDHALSCLTKSNTPFQVIFTSTMLVTIAACVESGTAVSLLPDSFITKKMRYLPKGPLSCPSSLKIGCAWNEDIDKYVLNTLLDIVQDHFDDPVRRLPPTDTP